MLDPIQVQAASVAIRELRVALSNFILYGSGNNTALLSMQRFLGALEGLFENLPSITLGESEGRLVVEGSPLDERATGSTNMLKDLFLTHKIHTLTFLKGLETEEIKTLFSLIKPRALTTGLSLSQALVQQSVTHIRTNEKVFVALNEGEVVVSSGEAPKIPEGQNLQEALEALQYFLQIFAKVKPDVDKEEVARQLRDHMGEWMASAGAPQAVGKPPSDARAWEEVWGGFQALKDNLSNPQKPNQLQDTKLSMEELLRKLVLLGESQGVKLEGKGTVSGGTGPVLETPPEKDQVLTAVEQGHWGVFWEPGLEQEVDRNISRLQDPDELETFEALWSGLWEKIFSGDEKTQALCLRHMNRLQWNRIPRALQLEGFRNLRKFLAETHRSAVYPIGLTLAQDWIPQELTHPDWEEVLEMVRLLTKLAEKKSPSFDKQNEAAKVALETVFCEPILESLLNRYQAKTPDGKGLLELFTILGSRMTPFLFQEIEEKPLDNPNWRKAVDFLDALQAKGHHVYEFWMEWPEKRTQMGKFLEIFKVTPPSGEMEDYFERHWNSFDPGAQGKILDIVEQWNRSGFRPFLLRLLEKPETANAYQALQVLSKVGLEGDAQAIAQAVKKYPLHSNDREKFWVKACQAMGALSDSAGAEILMEWADKYKMLEKKKDRGIEVRKAAIEALGHFKTKEVKDFLTSLRKDPEKELQPAVENALRQAT